MSRLIDADKIIDSLGNSDMDFAIGAVIDEQPTAFDVDEVVQQLEILIEDKCSEWQKKYLKEAWACDSGAKALEKQIPCKPEEYVPDFPYNIFSTQKCAKCGTPVIGKKISKYCFECGQKIDWSEENDT